MPKLKHTRKSLASVREPVMRDKLQKFDYIQTIENYLNQNQVFELFEDLTKQLVVCRPDKPLEFILQKIKQSKIKRVLMSGAPGTKKTQCANELASEFDWKTIDTGKLLRSHCQEQGEHAKRIQACFDKREYVDDNIVVDLVEKAVAEFEKKSQSWIISGFPRTRVQALSLQKLKIIPSRFINLRADTEIIMDRFLSQLEGVAGAQEIAERALQEFQINEKAVNEIFNQFIYQKDVTFQDPEKIFKDLHTMLRLTHRSNAPRCPPKVVLIGPPGSGRSTMAQMVADTFGMVNVSPMKILHDEAERNPPIKMKLQEAAETGVALPDEILLRLVDQRLRQSDCRVNGWILDGFPETESQVNLLKSMRINPSLVVMLEQTMDQSITRLAARRIDPMSGEIFNMDSNPPQNQARLQHLPGDAEDLVRKRFAKWEESVTMLEENYQGTMLGVQSEQTPEMVFDCIRQAIETPM